MIDLRSDTVTRPSAAMRRAMAEAPVGDDQFGEDPSVNRLQEMVAALLGKEAALFVPSGTMANQLALKLYTQPGDDVVVSVEAHATWHETGAGAANAGVQFTEIGDRGWFEAAELEAVIRPRGHMLYPPTTLVQVEDTHNRKGGVIVPPEVLRAVGELCRERGIATYLDGARMLNAAVARGDDPAALAAPFDVAAIALSKGLGCPLGSVLAGSAEDIARLVRYRRMLGGALRQAGIVAAAGVYALEHNVERLAEDAAHARLIADAVGADSETNIVVFHTERPAAEVVARARADDVLVMAFGAHTVRAVTHLDVTREECGRAAQVLRASL